MKAYKVEFMYMNVDNSLYTDERAAVVLEIKSDDYASACLLCEHLLRVYGADHYEFLEQ
jgi:hypothetical protein